MSSRKEVAKKCLVRRSIEFAYDKEVRRVKDYKYRSVENFLGDLLKYYESETLKLLDTQQEEKEMFEKRKCKVKKYRAKINNNICGEAPKILEIPELKGLHEIWLERVDMIFSKGCEFKAVNFFFKLQNLEEEYVDKICFKWEELKNRYVRISDDGSLKYLEK